jgi:hypothetical protein
MLTDPRWRDADFRHGFLEADDCAACPDWDAVVRAAGGPAAVAVPHQVHGIAVVDAGSMRAAREATGTAPDADAVVVGEPGLAAGILTADCVPVLLVDRARRVGAAVHAGWRGAAAGVLEAAVERLVRDNGTTPAAIEAAIGPAVGPCCYVVGEEVRERFVARTGDLTSAAWTRRDERLVMDLRAVARLLLAGAGVEATTVVGGCTACSPRLHSFRRDREHAGRQLSFIGWR